VLYPAHASPTAWLQAVQGSQLLAIGDEGGCVSIVDMSAEHLPGSLCSDMDNPPRARWAAHYNAIFDLAWAKVGRWLMQTHLLPQACIPLPFRVSMPDFASLCMLYESVLNHQGSTQTYDTKQWVVSAISAAP
jgi:hypothetical protein